MKVPARIQTLTWTMLCMVFSFIAQSQEINYEIGVRESISSEILNETRTILIHLPDNYDSKKSYPVLYRLDGDTDILLETVVTANRLTYSDEIAPEMIIVTIENTNRSRDMWPVNSMYFPEPEKPGAKNFLQFMDKELIPFIDSEFKTNRYRILCGQSLSGLFVMYTFLTKPDVFNAYLIGSAGFPGCEDYFNELIDESIHNKDRYAGRKLFMTNGLLDPLDQDGLMHQQIEYVSDLISEELAGKVLLRYKVYEDEGHVPFHSLYDGLRYFFQSYVIEND